MATTTETDDDLGGAFGSEYNENLDRQVKEKEKELKSQNLRTVFGSGIGRIAIIVFGLVIVAMVFVGVYNMFFRAPPPVQIQSASSAVLNQPSQQGDYKAADEEEAKLRRQAIAEQSKAAEAKGATYLAPSVLKDDPAQQTKTVSAADREREEADARAKKAKENAEQDGQEQDRRAPRANPELRNQYVKEIQAQLNEVLGRNQDGSEKLTASFSTSRYDLPDRTVKADPAAAAGANASGASAASQAAAQQGPLLISAGYGFYCEVRYKTNTDAVRKEVVADCYQGATKGATLIGKGELSPDTGGDPTVSLSFDKFSRPGKPTLAVVAIGLDDETEEVGMADSVDEHGIKKYGGLAVASFLRGMGKAASIVTGSSQTQTVGNVTTMTTNTDQITASKQAKISAGEVGTTFSDILQKRSELIKPTVKLNKQKGIRVVFLADVFDQVAK